MQTQSLYILLADDDEDDRLLFKDAFNEIKIKTLIEVVNDGDELMNLLADENAVVPNLLFLNLYMPRKTGLECLEEIKKMKHLKEMKIAIYSTSASEKDIDKAFVKGANVYIKKPNDFKDLKKLLSEVVTLDWESHDAGGNRENFFLNG